MRVGITVSNALYYESISCHPMSNEQQMRLLDCVIVLDVMASDCCYGFRSFDKDCHVLWCSFFDSKNKRQLSHATAACLDAIQLLSCLC